MDWNQWDPMKGPESEENQASSAGDTPENTSAPREREPLTQNTPPVSLPEELPEQPAEPASAQPASEPEKQPGVPGEQPAAPWYTAPPFNTYHVPGPQQHPPFEQPVNQGFSSGGNAWTPPPRPAKGNKGLRIFAGILAGVMILIIGISGGYLVGTGGLGSGNGDYTYPWNQEESSFADTENNGNDIPGETSDFNINTSEGSEDVYSYEQIVASVSKSIVNITVYSSSGEAGSYASGIIMDAEKGYVLTNDHIYSETPNPKFLITLNDGTEFKASFVSGDSRSDIGIIKIDDPKNLVAATFSTQTLQVGERVLAIGQSYGYADTVSEGIVSAVDRRVSLSSGSYSEKYIQTTAAINPGNSGGALVNMAGQVVGVTSAKIASQDVEGLGFAIPAAQALSIVENLQQNGKVVGRAKLGITYTEVGTVLAEVNGIPTGLYIQEIGSDSDLYGKGFSAGDIITHINGKAITMATAVLDIIDEATTGDTVTLKIYKASTQMTQTVTVTLIEAESTSSYTTQTTTDQAGSSPFPYEYYFGE